MFPLHLNSEFSDANMDDTSTKQGEYFSFNHILKRSGACTKRLEPSRKRSRLDLLEKEVKLLRATRDDRSTNFCGLNFTSRREADNWLVNNSADKRFGLILDVHAVCEHVYCLMYGKDSTLSNLHDLAKIMLKTDSEGIQVTSFERRIPKLFSRSQNFRMIRSEDCYFDQILKYSDWDLSEDGYRDSLLSMFNEFQHDHKNLLHQEIEDHTSALINK